MNSSLAENEDYYPFKVCEEIIFKPFYTVVSPRCPKEKRVLRERSHCTAVHILETASYYKIMKTVKVTAKSCIGS